MEEEVGLHIEKCSVSLQCSDTVHSCLSSRSGLFVAPNKVLTAAHGLPEEGRGGVLRYKGELITPTERYIDREKDLAILYFDRDISSDFAVCAEQPIQEGELAVFNNFMEYDERLQGYRLSYDCRKDDLKGSFSVSASDLLANLPEK